MPIRQSKALCLEIFFECVLVSFSGTAWDMLFSAATSPRAPPPPPGPTYCSPHLPLQLLPPLAPKLAVPHLDQYVGLGGGGGARGRGEAARQEVGFYNRRPPGSLKASSYPLPSSRLGSSKFCGAGADIPTCLAMLLKRDYMVIFSSV